MYDEDQAFDRGEVLGEKDVEECSEAGDGDHEEGAVPAFESVAWLVEDNEILDLGGDEVGYGGYRGLLVRHCQSSGLSRSYCSQAFSIV